MPNPYAPKRRTFSGGGQWPSDLLFERLTLLGFGIRDFEGLVDAFGDPDFESDAKIRYAVGDVELKSLVAASKGHEAEAWETAQLSNNPGAVVGDNYGREFDISWPIPALLTYVGDDARRAAWVLAAENAQPRQRGTLMTTLGRILAHG